MTPDEIERAIAEAQGKKLLTCAASVVEAGDEVLDIHGFAKVVDVDHSPTSVIIRYASGACRHANPAAPFRVRREVATCPAG